MKLERKGVEDNMLMKIVRWKGSIPETEQNIYRGEFAMGNDEEVIKCLNLIQEKLEEQTLLSVTEEDSKNWK